MNKAATHQSEEYPAAEQSKSHAITQQSITQQSITQQTVTTPIQPNVTRTLRLREAVASCLPQPTSLLAVGLLMLGSSLLSSCSVEKARALQGAAVQFRAESLAAIQAIDDMHRQELEPPPRSPTEVRRDFISGILNARSDINGKLIDLALNPYQPPEDPEWTEFITTLRSQYENFAAIFDKIDAGNLVSVEEVRRAGEYGKNLTVQMALFADAISKNPPVLYRYRNTIVVKLRKQRQVYQDLMAQVKANYGSIDASPQSLREKVREVENQVGELMGEWQDVKQQEQKLLETTVAQCLKAALLGKELGQLASQYDKLDLNQINLLIPRILTTASSVTGRDYSALRLRAATVIGEIKDDPLWRDATNLLLDKVNSAAAQRLQTQPLLKN